MKLDKGEDSVRSLMGSICSLVLLVTIAGLGLQKLEIQFNKKDDAIMQTVNDSHYDFKYIFDHKQGFNIAVALTAYDNEKEIILKPQIGELRFNRFHWGE